MAELKDRFVEFIRNLQDEICLAIESLDGEATFQEDLWERPGGGGGRSRVLSNGKVFEKAGVSTSIVHGEMPEALKKNMGTEGHNFSPAAYHWSSTLKTQWRQLLTLIFASSKCMMQRAKA